MKKLLPVLFALVTLIAPVFAQEDTVVEEIVARVNNSIITRADLRRSRDQMKQEVKQQNPPDANKVVEEREKNLLRDLIDQQLLVQKGQDLGISADSEVVKRLDELRKEMNANSMEDLEKIAEQQGVSFEDFKQNMKNNIITQQVIGREVGGKVSGSITHDDIVKFYNEHKAELDQPERVRLSEILIAAVPPQPKPKEGEKALQPLDPTPEQLAAAEAKANLALQKLNSGAKFEEVAREFSSGPTADQGGDLGYFKRGVLAKELEEQTFGLKPGSHTGVIRTKQGFVILETAEHIQAGIPPLNQVEPQIQEQLYYQRIQPALRAFLTKLREDAYIDVRKGYVDAGASANQTMPVYTNASTTPDAKSAKAKKKKKFGIF